MSVCSSGLSGSAAYCSEESSPPPAGGVDEASFEAARVLFFFLGDADAPRPLAVRRLEPPFDAADLRDDSTRLVFDVGDMADTKADGGSVASLELTTTCVRERVSE